MDFPHAYDLLAAACKVAFGNRPGLVPFQEYVQRQCGTWLRNFRHRVEVLLNSIQKALQQQPHRELSDLVCSTSPEPAIWQAYKTLFPGPASDTKALPTYITWLRLVIQYRELHQRTSSAGKQLFEGLREFIAAGM